MITHATISPKMVSPRDIARNAEEEEEEEEDHQYDTTRVSGEGRGAIPVSPALEKDASSLGPVPTGEGGGERRGGEGRGMQSELSNILYPSGLTDGK